MNPAELDRLGEHPDYVLDRLLTASAGRTLIPSTEVVDGLLDVQQALTRWRLDEEECG